MLQVQWWTFETVRTNSDGSQDCVVLREKLVIRCSVLITLSLCAEGAQFLNCGEYDIAINWSGGLHHAKKSCASGKANQCCWGCAVSIQYGSLQFFHFITTRVERCCFDWYYCLWHEWQRWTLFKKCLECYVTWWLSQSSWVLLHACVSAESVGLEGVVLNGHRSNSMCETNMCCYMSEWH